MLRPVPRRPRTTAILFLAVATFLSAVLFICLAIVLSRPAKGAAQVPDLTPFVEADCYKRTIDQYARIGHNIPQNSPDQAMAHRREWCGDRVAEWASMAADSDREQFQAVIDYACEALRVYWPWKWQTCRPCEN